MNGGKFYWPDFVPIGTQSGSAPGPGISAPRVHVDDYAGVTPALRGVLAGAPSGSPTLWLIPTNVGETRAMPPWLNDNCPQGWGGPRTAPPGQSNRSSHGRTVGASVPDYGPHRQWSRAAPAVPNVPCAPVAIYAIPRSMDGGCGRCRSPQAGMVSLTIVPCLYSIALSSGSVAPYMVSRPEA